MADLSIRNDFLDGVQEIFSTLFNDGVNDGLDLYLLSDETKISIYGESKYRKYKAPIRLVCRVRLETHQGGNYIEVIKKEPQFIVPYRDMQLKGLDISSESINKMKQGIIKFRGVYYIIDEILPVDYIEDVYLFYHFICTEDKECQGVVLESGEEDE